jgi:hypothetical protein
MHSLYKPTGRTIPPGRAVVVLQQLHARYHPSTKRGDEVAALEMAIRVVGRNTRECRACQGTGLAPDGFQWCSRCIGAGETYPDATGSPQRHGEGIITDTATEPGLSARDERAEAREDSQAKPAHTGADAAGHTECKCDLRTKLVGDGCSICNPELAAYYTATAGDAGQTEQENKHD